MTLVTVPCRGAIVHAETSPGERWRAIAETLTDSSLAHAPEWCHVIRTAYGHDPVYLSAEDEDGCTGLLPAFVIRRPLAGMVVTSMPFLDTGGPCAASAPLGRLLVERLLDEARSMGADAVDIRCTQRLDLGVEPMQHKANMVLSLPDRADRLWTQIDSSVRNQIRKADRSHLSVEFGGLDRLHEFYSIFTTRMHDLGSPVHALKFFIAMFDAFEHRARVALVRRNDAAIGGLIALEFKDSVVVPWACCLKEFFTLCPNMLLYWETIRSACEKGFRRFDFGRSTRGSGTYRFKRQWRAEEAPLFWYTVSLRPHRTQTLASVSGSAALLGEVWQRLPLVVTRHVGPHLRKYLIE